MQQDNSLRKHMEWSVGGPWPHFLYEVDGS